VLEASYSYRGALKIVARARGPGAARLTQQVAPPRRLRVNQTKIAKISPRV